MKACSLTATDEDGVATPLTLMLLVAVNRRPSLGVSTRVDAQRYIIGDSMRVTVPEGTGGDGTLVYILLPTLAKGLDDSESVTRTISATPSKALTGTEYTLSALDADGDSASLTFTLEVQQVDRRLQWRWAG